MIYENVVIKKAHPNQWMSFFDDYMIKTIKPSSH
jgi:hypothetical protein